MKRLVWLLIGKLLSTKPFYRFVSPKSSFHRKFFGWICSSGTRTDGDLKWHDWQEVWWQPMLDVDRCRLNSTADMQMKASFVASSWQSDASELFKGVASSFGLIQQGQVEPFNPGTRPEGTLLPHFISIPHLCCFTKHSISAIWNRPPWALHRPGPQLRLPLLFMQMTNIPNWNKFKEFIKSMQISCIMGTGTWLKPLLRPLYGSPGDFSCFLFEISRNFWSRDFPLKFYRICEMRILGIFVWPNKVSTQMGSMLIDNEEPSARARCTRIHHPTN